MKQILITWWCLVCCCMANAQVITVRDSVSNQPLEQATLVSDNPFAFTVTNAEGQADISGFKDAEKIQIRMLGYATQVKSYADLQGAPAVLLIQTGVSLDHV